MRCEARRTGRNEMLLGWGLQGPSEADEGGVAKGRSHTEGLWRDSVARVGHQKQLSIEEACCFSMNVFSKVLLFYVSMSTP